MAQTTELATLQKNLESWLAEHDSIMVAYSGGVDSTLLLAVTHRVLSSRGKRIIACIGTSPSNPERELQAALAIAHQLGVNVRVVHTEEFRNPNYIANLADRCYHCKLGLCRQLQAIATAENFSLIIDGNNADDAASDDRPGSLAGQQLGIRSPLVELGITKEQVRTMAKDLNLPNWNKPSTPCTSTRIPYGTPITTAALKQIEFAETALLDMGFKTLRVRHHSGGNGGGGG
ncbi:MAG: ATP-dependent sacrificial sulfur transferase LarE, partial [Phycisphaerales bacterium]|nr:ATP-dependent sacrificial sulfur transferase LarE [Phycisphaerales bacterium]